VSGGTPQSLRWPPEAWPSSKRRLCVVGFNTLGLEGADPAPLLPSSAALRGWSDLIKPGVARADSRAAHPCSLLRRFGEAAWEALVKCILNSQVSPPDPCWGKQTCRILRILAI